MLIDIIIYILVSVLLLVLLLELPKPLGTIAAVVLALIITMISGKMFGFGVFTFLLVVWMILIIAGLYGLRYYYRMQKHRH
ncbi:hypothetical protein [Lacticaseibacillus zhaodongensis]|uniref:hypothetical protein n=1 Tax=Lacticaseibacillus zhaodongensis TaxID=2668065 RepID=UPI0012D33696|nr:hypothetical protein [Lacticaseibacillus zhaodongensis]